MRLPKQRLQTKSCDSSNKMQFQNNNYGSIERCEVRNNLQPQCSQNLGAIPKQYVKVPLPEVRTNDCYSLTPPNKTNIEFPKQRCSQSGVCTLYFILFCYIHCSSFSK